MGRKQHRIFKSFKENGHSGRKKKLVWREGVYTVTRLQGQARLEYVCYNIYVRMDSTFSRLWIDRVWSSILLVAS